MAELKETYGEDYPTCPACGFADQDWWDGLEPKNDGDSWEVECRCGAKNKITMCVSVTFDTEEVPHV